MNYAERLTREQIQQIPDGAYRFADYLDYDGINYDQPVKIEATVEVIGSEITIDFSGSSPQVRGAINSVPSSTRAAVYYAIRSITDPNIPNNDGCFRPIKINFPKGTIVNPTHPAAVSVRTVTIKRVVDVLMGCFAQAIPEKVPAASCGQLAVLMVGGQDPHDGHTYVTWQGIPTAGGMGARPNKDGIDVIDTDVTNLMTEPIEATEMDCPIRVHEVRLWTDSGGAGRYRGGLGYYARTELIRGDATLIVRRDRHEFAPWGLCGGRPAPRCQVFLLRGEERRALPSKIVTSLRAGDQLETFTTGGAGYGDPLMRPVEDVLEDVLDGRVSAAAAERDYGVVLVESESGLEVDAAATAERRKQLHCERGPVTWMFDRGEDYEIRLGLPARH